MVCYASLIYIQWKLFIESFFIIYLFFSPLCGISTVFPGYLTVGNASTPPQHPMILRSDCKEARQRANICTIQNTCDIVMEFSCGVSPHRLQPKPLWVLASFRSLLLPVIWEVKDKMKLHAFAEIGGFHFLFFIFSCMIWVIFCEGWQPRQHFSALMRQCKLRVQGYFKINR